MSPGESKNPDRENCETMRYLARQPILDLYGKVHGYELLYRSGPGTVFTGDGEFATSTMIDNTVLFGLEGLTGGLPAFINCTAETLTSHAIQLLPPSLTVLEILETVEPSAELIAACTRFKGMGFRIALDDFVWKSSLQPLIDLADYIKIDFAALGKAKRSTMLEHLRKLPATLIAEKVETVAEYKQAYAEGFTLFQGYYFCRPLLLSKRKVPSNKVSHFQLLRVLRSDPLNLYELGELVKRDAALTYRLLRLVNSPACAIRQQVTSIEFALVVVGDDLFRRVATLAIASELNSGRPNEILRMAFVRARFCELASNPRRLDDTEQYLLGMFSLLPAMLQIPMSAVVSSLPLRTEVQEALLGEHNPSRCLLDWVEAAERGDWARCDELAQILNLPPAHLQTCFTEAVLWADLVMPATS
jgi:EAL and modified HD-GYP domain-containing signal transduction protein